MTEADSKAAGVAQRELLGGLPAGTRLRHYELLSVLGHGGFGITYHARDLRLDRDVALKEYLPITLALRRDNVEVAPRSTELASEFVWGRDRFLDEARILAKLDRAPAIVRVYDFLEANGTAYMVMALATGHTLEQRLKRDGQLPLPAVERLIHPLLNGLEHVHKAGFLHRDIKPANVVLDDAGNPTLIDFGASRAAMAQRSTAMTAIFTPGFAAAEQFSSAKQGPWTDIYGLSATLYCAITGKVPPSAFDRMIEDSYEPLSRLRPTGFYSSLLSGIDAGMALRASDRPQSITEWRQNLSQPGAVSFDDLVTEVIYERRSVPGASEPTIAFLPSLPVPTVASSVEPASGMLSPKRRGQVLWVGVVATFVLLAGTGYYAFVATKAATAVPTETAEHLPALEQRKADAAASAATALGASPSTPLVAPGAPPPSLADNRAYDGRWLVMQSCEPVGSVRGATIRYDMVVTNGLARGQWGTEGKSESLTITGQILADGTATMSARGLTGDSKYSYGPPNTPISYDIAARFETTRGTGIRMMGRPCSFTFTKN